MPRHRVSTHLTTILFLLLLGSSGNTLAMEDGPTILAEVIARHHLPYEKEVLSLKLTDRNDNVEVRELRRYTRRMPDRSYRHLIIVDHPEKLAGTALLAWQGGDQPSRYWTYLPAVGELREQRAAAANGRRYFLGTDLTYEDLALEDIDNFDYERMPDRKINGESVYLIRAVPVGNAIALQTGYLHRDIMIRKQDYLMLGIDYFGRRGRLIKELRSTGEPVAINSQTLRMNHLIMTNKQARHRTELITLSRDTSEEAVPAQMFEPSYLANGSHLKQ